jgi:anti-sigma factor RsiW
VVHDRMRTLLPMLADGALGPVRRFLLGRHMARCPVCAGELENLQAMRSAIRTALPYHRAPPGLATRIVSSLPVEATPPDVRPWWRGPAWNFSATGLAGALAGVALTLVVIGNATPDRALRDVVDDHIRSMMADHLTDVATSDRHTVKPWLTQRLDVAPPVRDLATDGFPLIGGRLDYINGHRAAAIVYRRDRHIINLFAWAAPRQTDTGFQAEAVRGFNIISWRHDGIAYAAVSDVEADQLARFARLVAAD